MPIIDSSSRIVSRFVVSWLLCCALGAAVAVALTPGRAGAQQSQSMPEARVIVSGEGNVQMPPDYGQIRGGVTTRGKAVTDTTDANSKTMAAIMAALADVGIAKEDIRTAQFTIHPIYQPQQVSDDPKLIGYSVTNEVIVSVHDIGKVSSVLDRMVAAGANQIGAAEFLVSDPSKALDKAREAAIADARRKAEVYSRASGFTLGRVAGISEEGGTAAFPVAGLYRATAAAQPVLVSAGEDTMRVRVTVGYDIAAW